MALISLRPLTQHQSRAFPFLTLDVEDKRPMIKTPRTKDTHGQEEEVSYRDKRGEGQRMSR